MRTSTRRNEDGARVTYLQLAHSEWNPAAKTSRTKVLYSFGRADELDRAAIERLITALTRLVGVEPAADGTGPDRARVVGVPGLEFTYSRPLGGAWLLDRLWQRLGIDTCWPGWRPAPAGARRGAALFPLAANWAWRPSKLAATGWLPDAPARASGRDRRRRLRAMDWLLAVEHKLTRGVFDRWRTCSTSNST